MDTVNDNLDFKVVPRKQTTRRLLAFQDSFRGFLDGSEFMAMTCPPDPDSSDFPLSVYGGDDEAQKVEAAMSKARKMARECSLQTIGSYQPYDVADPTTWNKKAKKKKRRESAGRPSTPVSNRSTQEEAFCAESSEMVAASTQHKNSYASAPATSAYAGHSAEEDDRKLKDGRRSGRKSGHRSHSPSRNVSGKKEKRSRRVPKAKASTVLVKDVLNAPHDDQSEGNEASMNRISASSTVSSSWRSEDTLDLRFDDLNLRHDVLSPETRMGSAGDMYRSDQSMSPCTKASNERECHSSQSSVEESSVMLHLELKEKMLQERLLQTARRLSELRKDTRCLPHDSNTAHTAISGVNSKAERRRQSYSAQPPVAVSGADAAKVRTRAWGVRRQSCDV